MSRRRVKRFACRNTSSTNNLPMADSKVPPDRTWRQWSGAGAHGVLDQRLAERPDRAGMVTVGDHVIERTHDPVAVGIIDDQGWKQLDRVAAVARNLGE